jgi:pyruvate-formate lyase
MNPNYAMIARTISMCHDYCQLLVRIWGWCASSALFFW